MNIKITIGSDYLITGLGKQLFLPLPYIINELGLYEQ